MNSAPASLAALNAASAADACALLQGIYEHSAWIAEAALAAHPPPLRFVTLSALKQALLQAVQRAPRERQLTLLCAHPELAGQAMREDALSAESSTEQTKAGLTACSPAELARISALNAAYRARFGFPFILAVRGPRGESLSKAAILASFERRLCNHPDYEFDEALRNVHRIAEIRLNARFGYVPQAGNAAWDWLERLAQHSEPGYAERGELTVTYLTDAHRACARALAAWMQECGFDEVHTDAVGNVVARYWPSETDAPYLLTGSHYDTVPNGGKYDGRLGIVVPMLAVQRLANRGERLPYGIELVAFSEEEGQRFPAAFIGSSALAGSFDPAWLELCDASGTSLREAMAQADLATGEIAGLKRDASKYLAYLEVHIEQGPVLNALGLPLAVVTSINGSLRYLGEIVGMASHAGTTPMLARSDAALAAAEWMLQVERRAISDGDSVATVGVLHVPSGAVNVVPGRCQFTLDLRAPTDAQRDALAKDILAELEQICQRRGLGYSLQETMRASAAPSSAAWQQRWERAVAALGLPVHRMPSGAGHDAMKMHEILPQAMLFVRGENAGISHNPLESSTSDDIQLAIDALSHLLQDLARPGDLAFGDPA